MNLFLQSCILSGSVVVAMACDSQASRASASPSDADAGEPSASASSVPPSDPSEATPVASSTDTTEDTVAGAHADPDPATVDDPAPAESSAGQEADGPGDDSSATDSGAKPPRKPKPLPRPVHGKVDPSCGNDGGTGQALKAFRLPTLDGKTMGHRSYGGRVLLVNFWGTWCKPCLEELPEFDRLYRRYRSHGLTLVAIATDTEPGPVREFVQRRKLGAKVLLNGEDYALQYDSPKFPFTFVVDPDGTIVGSYRGFRKECMGKLEADIRTQLERRNAP